MKFMYSAGDRPLPDITIKRAIHRGGFGEVYYAQTDSGKEVAIKLLHENREIELRGVSQCLNLKHPNLVTIFDIRTDREGDHWVVMEYIAGPTLAEKIRQHPSGMPVAEVARIFEQVAAGLEFLHSRSLVHRDLKPANIFLENGLAKIGDVGLSKFIGPSRRSAQTQSVGTVHYMAPEVAKGQYAQSVDLYALGVILFEMLTGRLPFEGESTGEILMKHLTQQPDLSRLSPQYRAVIARALEKEEQRRFGSIQDFRRSFQKSLPPAIAAGLYASPASEEAPVPQPRVSGTVLPGTEPQGVMPQGAAPPVSGNPLPAARNSWLPANGSFWWLAIMLLGWLPFIRLRGRLGVIELLIFLGVTLYCLRRFNGGSLFRSNPQPNGPAAPERVNHPPASPVANPVADVAVKPFRSPPKLVERTPREKLVGLFQAMALTPVLVTLIAFAIALFSRDFFASIWSVTRLDPAHFGFFIGSAVLASWGILLMTQRQPERPHYSPRRLPLFLAGAVCGLGIYGLSEWFLVQYPAHLFPPHARGIITSIGQHELAAERPTGLIRRETSLWNSWSQEFSSQAGYQRVVRQAPHTDFVEPHIDTMEHYPEQHQAIAVPDYVRSPTLLGYALFFGSLFGVRSWNRLAHYRREYRFRWLSMLFSAGVAYLICCLFTFPTVWGMIWAAAITATVQLSAPCLHRTRLLK